MVATAVLHKAVLCNMYSHTAVNPTKCPWTSLSHVDTRETGY